MLYAWAKDWGLRGFDHLNPQLREKNRQYALKRAHWQERQKRQDRFKKK